MRWIAISYLLFCGCAQARPKVVLEAKHVLEEHRTEFTIRIEQ